MRQGIRDCDIMNICIRPVNMKNDQNIQYTYILFAISAFHFIFLCFCHFVARQIVFIVGSLSFICYCWFGIVKPREWKNKKTRHTYALCLMSIAAQLNTQQHHFKSSQMENGIWNKKRPQNAKRTKCQSKGSDWAPSIENEIEIGTQNWNFKSNGWLTERKILFLFYEIISVEYGLFLFLFIWTTKLFPSYFSFQIKPKTFLGHITFQIIMVPHTLTIDAFFGLDFRRIWTIFKTWAPHSLVVFHFVVEYSFILMIYLRVYNKQSMQIDVWIAIFAFYFLGIICLNRNCINVRCLMSD